jgi:hypothetical protein
LFSKQKVANGKKEARPKTEEKDRHRQNKNVSPAPL